jgi:WD40 repeat protein
VTSADNYIKLWNVHDGQCLKVLDDHTETVTALTWLPDGSGFISSALDRHIIEWVSVSYPLSLLWKRFNMERCRTPTA